MRASFLAAIVAAASCVASTASAKPPPWREGEPVPDGYHVVRTSTDAALAAGTALMVPAATFPLVGLDTGPRGTPLLLPGIGPFIAIATLAYDATSASLLALLGVTQVAGTALFVWGAANPSARLAPDRVAPPFLAPVGSHWEHYDPAPAILSGATLIALPWILGTILVAPSLRDSSVHAGILVPVVGPLIEMGMFAANERTSTGGMAIVALGLGLDAIVQGAGLAMILGGALHRSNYIVKDRVQESVHLTPIGPAGSPGLSLVGTW